MPEGPLTIYHASAGTGKTFTLVANYLSLLMDDTHAFRHILAVTFTNKATAEMKERIIRVLYGLTRTGLPDHESRKEVREAMLYLQYLPEDLREKPEQVRKKAALALQLILFEYPLFSVQTIDSFFQRVLRGFARELDLPFSYEMEFDEDPVLQEITDQLLVQAGEDTTLLEWLIRMMEDLGADTGNWDVKSLLMQQGKNIFTEEFKSLPPEVLAKLTERSFLREYLRELSGVLYSFEKKMKELGERGRGVFRETGVDESFFAHKGSGVAGIFRKLADGRAVREGASLFGSRFMSALDDPGRWLSGENKKDPVLVSLVRERLHPLIVEIFDHYEENAADYYTALVIRKRLYTLGLMADLRQQLFLWMKEKNRLLISETGTFLREIIGENDIPFIYEKVGQYYSHFMIDEFQDTSRIQYEDLRPLLRNSMSAGGTSLIVGDIKQSLYRWRNGDWEIMHRDVYRDLAPGRGVKRMLKVNYRSREEIVRFNNAFFVAAAGELWKMYSKGIAEVTTGNESFLEEQQDILASIYDGEEVVQEVPQGAKGGYVSVRLLHAGAERSWREEALEACGALIDRLTGAEGWSPGEIMVLVRSNRDGREVIRYLLTRQHDRPESVHYPLVSQDSLYLAASPAVRFLVAFLRYLTTPDDLLNFATLWSLYERLQKGHEEGQVPPFHLKDIAELPPGERIFLFLDGEKRGWLSLLMTRPLPEVVQEIVRRFGLHEREEEVPFLHTFQNFLTAFVTREGSGATAFLKWWDEQGWQESVQLPEEADAVRVMTIHKAKGLGAAVVIMPFADWEFEQRAGTGRKVLWCRPGKAPFNKTSLVPVEYTGMLLRTLFALDFMKERFSAYLDNLNLLYVACTRARERLYVFTPAEKGRDLSGLLVKTLGQLTADDERSGEEKGEGIRQKEDDLFESGQPVPPSAVSRREGVRVREFPDGKAFGRLRIAGKGREFFLLEKGGYKERIDRGTLYHNILAEIMTPDDVERAVGKVVRAGLVSSVEKERLVTEVKGFLAQKEAAGWFSGEWQVKTEAAVILPGGKTLRPDRVMVREGEAVVVDYKFGTSVEDKYIRQVKRYMEVLKKMGYQKVTGVVWYVMLGKMTRIDE